MDRDDEFHGRSAGELFGFTEPTNCPDWPTLEEVVKPFSRHSSEARDPAFEIGNLPLPDDRGGYPRASAAQALAQVVWIRYMALHRFHRMEAIFIRPVLDAIQHDNRDALQLYIEAGLSPSFRMAPGFLNEPLDKSPPLVCVAAYYSACDVLRCLRANAADFAATDSAGDDILVYATGSGSVDTFTCLAELAVNPAGCGPALISSGRSTLLLELLDRNVIGIGDANAEQCTLLHAASYHGDVPVMLYLLRRVHTGCTEGGRPDFFSIPGSRKPRLSSTQWTDTIGRR
jgi:hypothetical protein